VRRALVGSFVFHIVVTVLIFSVIAFNSVKYVPRNVYEVKLVGAVEAAKPAAAARVEAAPPKPAPVEEKKVEEKEDQMPAPPKTPKKPKPEEKKQHIAETTDIRKTDAKPDSSLAGSGEPAAPGPPGDQPAMGSVSIDGGNFPFASYISRMRQKIATTWEVPPGTEGLERNAVVYFRIHRDGSVTNVTVDKLSGLQIFDRSCQRAVIEAAPMPPLPREYNEESVAVHFTFVYQPTE
jgi:TonB family protein